MKSWPKILKIGFIVGGSLTILILSGLTAFLLQIVDIFPTSNDLEKQVALSKANGDPWVQADLGRHQAIKDSENAAVEVNSVADILALTKDDRTELLHRSQEFPINRTRISDTLERVSQLEALANAAADKSHLDFKPDFDLGSDLKNSGNHSLYAMVVVLRARSYVQAMNGLVKPTLKTLGRISSIARKASESCQDWDGARASRRVQYFHNDAVNRIGSIWIGERSKLKALDSYLAQEPDPAPLKTFLPHEFYLGIADARNISSVSDLNRFIKCYLSGEKYLLRPPIRKCLPSSLVGKSILQGYLKAWNGIHKELSLAKDEEEVAKLFKELSDQERALKISGVLSDIHFLRLDALAKEAIETRKDRSLIRSFVKVILYEAEHHRWPETLEQTGEGGEDLVNKFFFNYLRTSTGFKVWTVGRNGVDHGGYRNYQLGKDVVDGDDVYAYPPHYFRKDYVK